MKTRRDLIKNKFGNTVLTFLTYEDEHILRYTMPAVHCSHIKNLLKIICLFLKRGNLLYTSCIRLSLWVKQIVKLSGIAFIS